MFPPPISTVWLPRIMNRPPLKLAPPVTPATSSVPPLLTLIVGLFANEPEPDSLSVPALTVVLPL